MKYSLKTAPIYLFSLTQTQRNGLVISVHLLLVGVLRLRGKNSVLLHMLLKRQNFVSNRSSSTD